MLEELQRAESRGEIMKKIIACILILTNVFVFVSCKQEQKVIRMSDNYRNYYEIFVRSFYDSDNDKIGDLKGVMSKLDYISEDLGADGIWLMPIMPSSSYHKYDITDYYSIDSQYGTLDDFRELITQAHNRDIHVIIDLVINHTSNQHPWFTQAVESLWTGEENQFSDYYNFTTEYKGSGYNQITDVYYYESRFTPDMPDLNLDNPQVRDEISKITKFWMDLGVDGFRLDAVTSYFTGNDTKNIEFMTWLNENIKEYKKDAYIVGEAWTTSMIINDYYTSGIDSFFNFPFSQFSGNIVKNLNSNLGETLAKDIENWNETILASNENAIDAPFLSNHDNARSAGFLMRDSQKEKMAAALYLLMPGNPFIYYGEEIGMTGSGNDPNKRLPMYWSSTDETGITYTPPDSTQIISGIYGVDKQITDKNSLLNFYKKVLQLKYKYPEIARGDIISIDTENSQICAYSIQYDGKMVYIFHNLSDNDISENLKILNIQGLEIDDYLLTEGTTKPKISNDILKLPPYSTVISEVG